MESVINSFLGLSLLLRVVIIFFLLFSIVWWTFGRKLLWLASLFPYLLIKIFAYIYLIVEFPVSKLHKNYGSVFSKIDSSMSHLGGKFDAALRGWYQAWRNSKEVNFGRSILLYALLVTYIAGPSLLGWNGSALLAGQKAYLYTEKALVGWFERHGWYEPVFSADTMHDSLNMTLIVSGPEGLIDIRNIPSSLNCQVLDSVNNGDTVIWLGALAFGAGDNGAAESWVKVRTKRGIAGWARFTFLHPENHDVMLYVTTQAP